MGEGREGGEGGAKEGREGGRWRGGWGRERGSNLHFFHFSLPCQIISYSSVLDSLITRLRFARVDGVVSYTMHAMFWLHDGYRVLQFAHDTNIGGFNSFWNCQ